ncbi:aliphatic sulfonate ABC transporter substrate-binding protein, partial [Rhizobium sp. BR5]
GNDPKITKLTINKRDWKDPVPGDELLNSIRIVTPLLGDDVLRPGVNVDNVLSALIDPAPAKKAIGA